MNDSREKLIELIVDVENQLCEAYPYTTDQFRIEQTADHLIDNGVTFATDTNVGGKWIPASEPPEDWKGEGGYLTNYYVYTEEYGTDIGNYFKPSNSWFCMGIPCMATHWMPLPEPPKEG